MPPKAARGAVRGRGSGRGRGKALAPDELEHQSIIANRSIPDIEPAASTIFLHEQSGEQKDPNSSPATQPTETPASTPARPPPPVTQKPDGMSTGSGTRGAIKAKPSKFKPKNVRADAKEREEREAKEREREDARLRALAAAAPRGSRGVWGRGRGGRGRGDAMGRGRMQMSGTASGPFAMAPAAMDKAPTGFFSAGSSLKRESGPGFPKGSGGGASGPRFKTEGGSSVHAGFGGGYNAAGYMPEPQYPDDDDTPRIDIEHINQISDDDDDVVITGVRNVSKGKGKANSNKGGLKPIRLDRREHKDRTTLVNIEPAIKAAPEDDEIDSDVVMIDETHSSKVNVPERKEWKGVYQDTDEVQIKREPDLTEEASFGRDPLSSPPSSKFKIPLDPDDDDPDDNDPPEAATGKVEVVSPRVERAVKPRRNSKKTDKKPVIQTEEDRAEWARHLEDMEILRNELGGMQTDSIAEKDKGKAKDIDGDIDMDDSSAAVEEKEPDKKEGRLYLFQFPPVLPKLYNSLTSPNPNITNLIDMGNDDDVQIMDSLDLTKDDNVKVKPEEEEVVIKKEDEDAMNRQRQKLVAEEGAIGKLIVRDSGRVEMIWGGTNMVVGRGVEAGFLSVGMLIDGQNLWQTDDNGKLALPLSEGEGKSLGMGKLMGKFVVTPNWDRIQ